MDDIFNSTIDFPPELNNYVASSDCVGVAIRRMDIEAFSGEYVAVISKGDTALLYRQIESPREKTLSRYECPPMSVKRLQNIIYDFGAVELSEHRCLPEGNGGVWLDVLLRQAGGPDHKVEILDGSESRDRRVRRFTKRTLRLLNRICRDPLKWLRPDKMAYASILLKQDEMMLRQRPLP